MSGIPIFEVIKITYYECGDKHEKASHDETDGPKRCHETTSIAITMSVDSVS
jgi:hypothetical protein